MRGLGRGFFRRPVDDVARDLIGTVLTVKGAGGAIVETESYDRHDPAAHTYRGPTRANGVMFGPPGHAYVYRSYGIHWCLNFTCGEGSAVLIRALEPLYGLDIMTARRGVEAPALLCAGPGRLCQALGIGAALNGASLSEPPFALCRTRAKAQLLTGRRIGISKAVEAPRRFGLKGSPFLSRPFRAEVP